MSRYQFTPKARVEAAVNDIFEQPYGALHLDPHGYWWINRRALGVDEDGTVTIEIADGEYVAHVVGTPITLKHLADAIYAQVDSAILNSKVEA